MGPVDQEDMEILGFGSVTGPPDLADIATRIQRAADAKETLELSAGELRVLATHFASCL